MDDVTTATEERDYDEDRNEFEATEDCSQFSTLVTAWSARLTRLTGDPFHGVAGAAERSAVNQRCGAVRCDPYHGLGETALLQLGAR